MKLKPSVLLFLLCWSTEFFSQKETQNWCFGLYSGLDFSTEPPTVTNSSIGVAAGCATISDAVGNLLFYTEGTTVWNKQHAVMANGTGLAGQSLAPQSSLIVKRPGGSDKYYIFTLDQWSGPNGLQYSEVDMSLAAGMGSVTVKNVLLHTPSTEKLCGVRHCNGTDVWVLSHDWNSDNFRAYLVTAAGVNTTAVLSPVGAVLTGTASNIAPGGSMKFSPSGKKLGFTNLAPSSVELYDFDNTTGIVSNSLVLATSIIYPYGCEFSSDGTKFYAAPFTATPVIYQWDLCAGGPAFILASQYSITPTPTCVLAGMQLAPDGKIYIAASNSGHALSIIHKPNAAGAAMNFFSQDLSISPKTTSNGLPNFVSSLVKAPFSVSQTQSCLTASFNPPSNYNCPAAGYPVTGQSWDFGEPASGAANTSTLVNPVHTYTAYGNYPVKLVIHYSSCAPDTIKQTLALSGPSISVQTATTACEGSGTASLNVTGGSGQYTYSWLPSAQAGSVATQLSSGIYSVSVFDQVKNCALSSTLAVSTFSLPVLTVNGNFSVCPGASSSLTAGGAFSYSWSSGATSAGVVLSPTVTSVFTVTGTDANSCASSKTVQISIANCSGIDEHIKEPVSLKIYPNPVKGELGIECSHACTLLLLDAQGKQILEKQCSAGKSELDINYLPGGIYFVRIKDAKAGTALKFTKID